MILGCQILGNRKTFTHKCCYILLKHVLSQNRHDFLDGWKRVHISGWTVKSLEGRDCEYGFIKTREFEKEMLRLDRQKKEGILDTLVLWTFLSEALELLEWNVAMQSKVEGSGSW